MTTHVRKLAAATSDVLDWLAANAVESLGAEIVLRSGRPRGDDLLVAAEAEGATSGAALVVDGGAMAWLEADGPASAAALFEAAFLPTRPRRLTVGSRSKALLAPLLAGRFDVVREHDQLAMTCDRPPAGGRGRWATAADVPDLVRYRELYAAERRTMARLAWTEQDLRETAVLDEGGRLVAVVRKSGATPLCACIGGTFAFPEVRRRGHAAAVTAFLVGELLRERPSVHLIVDADNVAAVGLYERLGFRRVGATWTAYLADVP